MENNVSDPLPGYRWAAPQEMVAYRLRELRQIWHMSQAEVARRAGTTQRIISGIEAGTYNPSLDLLVRIAAVFRLRLDIAFRRSW